MGKAVAEAKGHQLEGMRALCLLMGSIGTLHSCF